MPSLPSAFPEPPASALAAASGGALHWDARAARHLLNRAGFGGSPEEIRRGVQIGAEGQVDALLAGEGDGDGFRHAPIGSTRERRRMRELPDEERREEQRMMRRDDREQLQAFLEHWCAGILSSPQVLEERMTLFWHGHFTSSQQDVQSSSEMIDQHELLRRNALGSFRDLLGGVARDPAMLEYLDNDSNRKGKPNENFARELLELFTLGEGHYSEEDVKEVARAFTGWTDRDGEFFFARRKHDGGNKRILGERGPLGGEDVLEILLGQKQCARHMAWKLLRYFEGVEPPTVRVKRYADLLRKEDWELRPFLSALFLDPGFYREEVVGARVTSPIDFLAGIARRGGIDPPPLFVAAGAALLGERLCYPPSVAGWKGGTAWITTGSLFLRANLAGVLVGEVDLRELLKKGAGDPSLKTFGARKLARLAWSPRVSFTRSMRALGLASDAEIARAMGDMLLAVEVSPSVQRNVEALLLETRRSAGIESGALLDRAVSAEPCLRRVAHYVLSLPEAQLH